jgi:folate-dependent phosphoribosylglycinamide formyltransferase PurN
MLKIVLFAPIDNSLYARLVAGELLKIEGVALEAIVVRSHWNLKRFQSEFGRDGARLLRKVYQKYFLGDARFIDSDNRNLSRLAEEKGLDFGSLKEFARLHEIPYILVKDLNDPASEEILKKVHPDLVAFTGGGLIRPNILGLPKLGVLNCHTGILPDYRGMDVVEWTAAEGRVAAVGFGATLHFMDKGVDSGPIILKRTISTRPNDDFQTIRERLEVVMVELMLEGIAGLRDGTFQSQTQKIEDGRQYFVMHPRIKRFAEGQLADQINPKRDNGRE